MLKATNDNLQLITMEQLRPLAALIARLGEDPSNAELVQQVVTEGANLDKLKRCLVIGSLTNSEGTETGSYSILTKSLGLVTHEDLVEIAGSDYDLANGDSLSLDGLADLWIKVTS
ncbi:hypothetical protein HNP46_000317 [Pseudomonas nitritireducens]|uniref:Uncharacterized protein n=1 Tax=Pseudomonas nitroreducens TaxID=46680 RepID=A0A7W7KES6_PSENT|nr:hypothetical protein [Pseudomonas nitritireducens]MBB4861506.1 hypothetical protein [Pseudomonas nitritireducens]